MDLLTLLLLSTVLAPVSSTPIVPPEVQGHRPDGSPTSYGTPSPPTEAPMKPILVRREALNIASPDNLSPVDTVIFNPLPSKGCTTTISETYSYRCSWDGTTTMYPSTTVLFQQINCNGCDNLLVQQDIYLCPNQRINGTLRMGVPSTSWSTVCRPSTAVAKRVGQDAPATTTASGFASPQPAVPVANPPGAPSPTPNPESGSKGARSPDDGLQPAACPTTLVVQPERSAGKTSTKYSTFTTTTVTVECSGCPLVISTALAGYGPPGSFVTTTTLPVGAITTYACR